MDPTSPFFTPQTPAPTFAFIDGEYLRGYGASVQIPYPHPQRLVSRMMIRFDIGYGDPLRTSFYDAENASDTSDERRQYWDAIEALPDTDVRWGYLKHRKRSSPPDLQRARLEQKGVDVQIAVDMIVGAFEDLFTIALLVAGDADLVPAVHEVRRRGKRVFLCSNPSNASPDLINEADRYHPLSADWLTALAFQKPNTTTTP